MVAYGEDKCRKPRSRGERSLKRSDVVVSQGMVVGGREADGIVSREFRRELEAL